ncbi:MAG: 4-(cytidine 5'-diphospho)-2-C-methyl-D-erythritol kinase [Porphyromonas sp.]|nr:4-(cytidine 5'-diphospho)-2-C-methyl-D-erythritol kinase [Porphyromonas sp.]
MIRFPKAKINLGLRVLRKRPDGYHDLQTCMVPIPLRDALELLPSDGEMGYDFGDWGEPADDNLVVRAYRLVRELRPTLPAVNIYLRKRIPTGAGLGGGSSDATNMLLLLDRQFELGLSPQELHRMATRLGADCSFFLTDTPQIAEGIGELLSPYPLDLEGKVLTLLLSDIHISTAEAYRGVVPSEEGEELRTTLQRPMGEWCKHLYNAFEPHIFDLHPALAEGKNALYEAGAVYAAMSGSGPTLFAISDAPLEINGWSGTQLTYTL